MTASTSAQRKEGRLRGINGSVQSQHSAPFSFACFLLLPLLLKCRLLALPVRCGAVGGVSLLLLLARLLCLLALPLFVPLQASVRQ